MGQILFFTNLQPHKQSTYCEQIHDSVTGLSEEGFSEADTEQRTRINCKTKCFVIEESMIEMPYIFKHQVSLSVVTIWK